MFSSQNSQVSNDAVFVEDVFSTFLYTGNGSTQTITNGIDLAGKGGLVWTKTRSGAASHRLFDTARGVLNQLNTDNTNAQSSVANSVTSFNADGFSIGNSSVNVNTATYASWTFRKQPKFFDVVTYTGTGSAQTIAHNLGSVPGCVITKATSGASSWYVYHRSMTSANYYMRLNLTDAQAAASTVWNNTAPTSTVFSVGSDSGVNAAGVTYVAYLFAHDAGGFGLTGTDNVISCGSYTESVGSTITLGYEPQYLLLKRTDAVSGWFVFDTMRGLSDSNGNYVYANTSGAEVDAGQVFLPQATGFKQQQGLFGAGANVIYIAIRRGPMKVPTSGTSVFIPLALNNASDTKNTTGFPVDLQFQKYRAGLNGIAWFDRLRGLSSVPSSQSATTGLLLRSSSTAAEVSTDNLGTQYGNTSFNTGGANGGVDMIYWNLRRAPSFFDEVCYTGTGSARTINHNLGVAPELMITKQRSGTSQWNIYQANLGASAFVQFTTAAVTTGDSTRWNSTAPTSSVFSLGTSASLNSSGQTYVWYGFATCAGVSKVGSYTGNGSSQTINCGFTGGARFVLIKATSAAGQWRVYDTARGIVAGNEPELFLNLTDAEQTVYDAIDTDSSGFIVNSNGANVNDSGVTYIFLAIA